MSLLSGTGILAADPLLEGDLDTTVILIVVVKTIIIFVLLLLSVLFYIWFMRKVIAAYLGDEAL